LGDFGISIAPESGESSIILKEKYGTKGYFSPEVEEENIKTDWFKNDVYG
jgi:hypothetical protein